jgi:hypothetical protein
MTWSEASAGFQAPMHRYALFFHCVKANRQSPFPIRPGVHQPYLTSFLDQLS